MAGPVLIIEIADGIVMAGLFSASRMEPAGFLMEPVPVARNGTVGGKTETKQALVSLLDTIKTLGTAPEEFSRIFVSLPLTEMSIRMLTLPFDDLKKVREAVPFELSGLLSVDIEETILDIIPLGGNKVLAVALEKKIMREYLETFRESGIDPYWAGSAIFSMPSLLKAISPAPGVKAFISKYSLIVAEDGKPRLIKPIKRIDGIRLGLSYLDSEGVRIDDVYINGWIVEEIRNVIPDARLIEELTLPDGYPPEGAAIYALSLKLKSGELDDTINFRKGEFGYTGEKARERRKLRFTSIVIAVILALFGADIYLRYMTASRELASYREALRSSYQRLFPGEAASGDELYRLEAKMKAIDAEASALGGNMSVLAILNRIIKSEGEGSGLTLTELTVANGRVGARGEAPSFEAADRLKDNLSKDTFFKDVTISDIKSGPGGVVFSLSMLLR